MPIRGFLLVGGQSRRMGQDKAMIDWKGKPLALHLAQVLLEAGLTQISLIGATSAHSHLSLPCLPDPLDLPRHPLRGVVGALEALNPQETALLCPIDLACLGPAQVKALLASPAPTCGAAEGQLQPLFCHVGPLQAGPARRLCATGGSVRAWAATFAHLELPKDALRNLNTPADLRSALGRETGGVGVD